MASKTAPKDGFPYASVALLLACAGATIAFDRSGGADFFVCYPRELLRLYGGPAFLSLFTHEGFPHLLLNSALLLPTAWSLEARFGPGWLIALFLTCGLAGLLGQASTGDVGTIGASGAIYGLIAASLITQRESKVGPLELTIAGLLCLDLVGLQSQAYGHAGLVGHAAHVAGAFAGGLTGAVTRPDREPIRDAR